MPGCSFLGTTVSKAVANGIDPLPGAVNEGFCLYAGGYLVDSDVLDAEFLGYVPELSPDLNLQMLV